MKIKQAPMVLAAFAVSALLLSACGTDNNTGSRSSSAAVVDCGGKTAISGDGSSAQANAMAEFAASYKESCSAYNVAYNVSSSGDGIKNFLAKQVDFAGSDSPLKEDEKAKAMERCGGADPLHLPLVFGPVAIAYNVPGVTDLVLTPDVVAKIFTGQIRNWNDSAITALNSGRNLPAKPIGVIFRSGQSGTTDNFQKYLSAAAPKSWTKGDGKEFKGGIGDGKAKSADVVSAVKSTEGGITYVEVSFAKSSGLATAKIDSGAGPVELSDASAGKAIANAKLKSGANQHDLVLDLNALYATKEAGAYPLMLVTYEIVCAKSADADTAKALKNFLTVASTSGQERLPKIGYVPLPQELRTKLTESIKSIS